MANRARGEVSVEAAGRTYTLRPTVNAICDLEEREGVTFAALAERAGRGDTRAVRALVWAYLQDKHGAEVVTLIDAGAWIEKAGGLRALDTAMQAVVTANSGPEAEAGADPREAQPAGVGATSTEKAAASG